MVETNSNADTHASNKRDQKYEIPILRSRTSTEGRRNKKLATESVREIRGSRLSGSRGAGEQGSRMEEG